MNVVINMEKRQSATVMAELDCASNEPQEELIEYLNIQDHSNKQQIIFDLLAQGRRSFCIAYINNLPTNLFAKVNSPKALDLMKLEIRRIWETRLFAVEEQEIQRLYDEKQENANQFDVVLTRLAENGCSHQRFSSQILFLVLELTFPLIVSDKNAAENLWIYLTIDGLKGLNHFSDDISPDQLMNELDQDSQTPLYLALRRYYKNEFDELIEKHLQNIEKKNFYDLTINSLTRHGWLESIKSLSEKIPPRLFEPFRKVIQDMVQEQKSKITKTFHGKLTNQKDDCLSQ